MRSRLYADAGNVLAVLESELEDGPQLVDVDRVYDGRHQHEPHVRLRDVVNGRNLFVQQSLPAQFKVDVVVDAIKLQIQRVQARILTEFCVVGVDEPASVRGNLNMRETQVAGGTKDARKLGVQSGLSAGELDVSARHWPIQQRLEHFAHQFRIEQVVVPVARGLRETHGTLEIAAVRDVDNGQAWLVVAGAGTVACFPIGWRCLLDIRKD